MTSGIAHAISLASTLSRSMGGVTGRSPERGRDEGLAKPATWLVSEMSFVNASRYVIDFVT